MNANDLYERRAERGRHRGAAEVWADAHHEVHAEQSVSVTPGRSPRWWSVAGFRVAFVALSLAALAALANPFGVFNTETAPIAAPDVDRIVGDPSGTPSETEPDTSIGQAVPAQLQIAGMTLDSIYDPRTWDGESGATSASLNGAGGPATLAAGLDSGAQVRVFTHPTDPYGQPVAIASASERGSSLVVVNGLLSQDEAVAEFSAGSWTVAEGSDYVLTAAFEAPETFAPEWWQLSFSDGADEAMWQATAHNGADEWAWILLVADSNTTFQSTEVLGQSGIEVIDTQGNTQVVWAVDGQAFRLTSSLPDGGASVVSRLVEAGDDEWAAAVDGADTDGPDDSGVRVDTVEIPLSYLATGLGVLIAGGFLGWFVYRERSAAKDQADD